ncbi:unnamed protein product [Fusarium graminearum]|nr:unnamed protein product [Fusarium graminearum]
MSTDVGLRNLAQNSITQRQKSLNSYNTKRLFNIHTASWFRGLTVMTADSDSASEGPDTDFVPRLWLRLMLAAPSSLQQYVVDCVRGAMASPLVSTN